MPCTSANHPGDCPRMTAHTKGLTTFNDRSDRNDSTDCRVDRQVPCTSANHHGDCPRMTAHTKGLIIFNGRSNRNDSTDCKVDRQVTDRCHAPQPTCTSANHTGDCPQVTADKSALTVCGDRSNSMDCTDCRGRQRHEKGATREREKDAMYLSRPSATPCSGRELIATGLGLA